MTNTTKYFDLGMLLGFEDIAALRVDFADGAMATRVGAKVSEAGISFADSAMAGRVGAKVGTETQIDFANGVLAGRLGAKVLDEKVIEL